MASLIKQHHRYSLQFYDSSRSPKRKRVSLGVSTKRDAKPLQRKLERLYANGAFDPWLESPKDALRRAEGRSKAPEALSLKEALDRFIDDKQRADRAESTLRKYRHIVGLFARRTGEDTKLHALSSHQIDRFCRESSIAQSTRRTRYRHVRAFLRWCAKEGYGPEALMNEVEAPKRAPKLPKAVTPDELAKICKKVREDYEYKRAKGHCRDGELIWLIPLFRFALYTGLRASELGRLRWSDADVERRLIYIREQKSGREQTTPLSKKAHEVLTGLGAEESPDAYVFASPTVGRERSAVRFREYVSQAFRTYRKKAEIDRPISFHGLRHGFCTLLAEAGKSAVVIKEAARHANVSTSMRYVHMANERLKAELDDAFE